MMYDDLTGSELREHLIAKGAIRPTDTPAGLTPLWNDAPCFEIDARGIMAAAETIWKAERRHALRLLASPYTEPRLRRGLQLCQAHAMPRRAA